VALLFASVGSAAGAFSGHGFETTDFGGTDTAQGVAIRSGGKIVVAGSTTSGAGAYDFALARFKRSGNLDDSFAGDGRQTTGLGEFAQAFDLAIQSNGRIVVVGTTRAHGQYDFALARYRKTGALDDSFSRNGKAAPDFARVAYGVAIQENGRIVVAGAGKDDFALARYKRNGHLDDSFSGNGKTTTDFGRADGTTRIRRRDYDSAYDVAIQPNGRIVVVGTTRGAGKYNYFALARYRQNGRLDRSFAGDGKRIVKFHGGATAEGVAIQENGRIVAAGGAGSSYCAFVGTSCAFAVARLKEDGGLDPSFGREIDGTGKTVGGGDSAFDLAIQRNGRVVLVGVTGVGKPPGFDEPPDLEFDFALARYKRDGHLDDSFSGNGTQTTAFGPGDEVAYDVAFQSRRKFVVAGVMSAGDLDGPAQDFLIARYRNNGELDD
jgi:uncharacterized delta-60 repeat protein